MRRTVIGASGIAVAVTGLGGIAVAPALANPAGTDLVINEVYGGGGNSGSTYTNDYIELDNPTGATLDVTGWSVSYYSAKGNLGGTTSLSGSVPAHGYYLVEESKGSGGTTPLPTPDVTGQLALSATDGSVTLTNAASTVVDTVGFGTGAIDEGADAPAPSNTTAVTRKTPGVDTDNNNADFITAAPDPINAAGQTGTGGSGGGGTGGSGGGGGTGGGTGGDAGNVTIAQIQGTNTDTSPLAGQTVTTQGVVTAAYPTGGFNGFYLETGGAGGTEADDLTPGASDAVFVYGSQSVGTVSVGESVQVTGTVQEFDGETEIDFPTVTKLADPLPAVVPDQIPWSDLQTDAGKEAHEGELMAPQGDFTVTDNYNTNFYGEVELAAGDQTLRQPTDAGTAGSDAAQQAADYNAAHAVTLDDGSSATYSSTGSAANDPLPWLTADNPVSVGAAATFHQPVILDYRNSQWDFQPTSRVNGAGTDIVSFSDMRSANAKPAAVGGAIKLATFNVENYFPMTGAEYVANGLGTCSYYNDRQGNHIAVDDCGATGPRGAADEANFVRQQDKIVTGINDLGASIVSLEEIENSVKFGEDRDTALSGLVDALNAAAGAGTWAYAPSPAAADLPPTAGQDVIRTGFIYKPADVALVGTSHVLNNLSGDGQDFSIAREPLAQGFKAVGAPDADAFLVVANHLKSKSNDAAGLYPGDDEDTRPAYDQGGYNVTRTHEAQDMLAFAQQQAQALGTDKVFLVGDFNSYTHEDPMQYLYGQGYTDLGSAYDPTHWSYSYNGLEGSLDHVLASPAAMSMVTGATIWQINAQESVGFAYSRYNYNLTQLFNADDPFAASDHDPVVVGLNPVTGLAPTIGVQVAPGKVTVGKTSAKLTVTVSADGVRPTGAVTVTVNDETLRAALKNGRATLTLPVFTTAGEQTLEVGYSGDAAVRAATTEVAVAVSAQQ